LTDNHSQKAGPGPGRKSARLGEVEARLGEALDGLERVLGAIETAGSARAADVTAQLVERDGRLLRLQEENAALQQNREEIAGRLDVAVDRLRRALAD